ncbi:MAG: hypothetical protein ACLP9S_09895 [Syntrophales bacterium]
MVNVNNDETRELVKRLVRERVAEKAGVQNIVYGGEEICVSNVEDGPMRINLPRLKKSYVVMSGRVYEREYTDDERRIKVYDQQPSIVTQLNYKREPENVDTTLFSNKLICACGNIRYVKNADMFQVTKCKPCTLRERNRRRHKH